MHPVVMALKPRLWRKSRKNEWNTPEKFWAKINKIENGCWEWAGSILTSGYGAFDFQGVRFLSHRLAWIFTNGDPKDKYVCHKCDNPLCCNPEHLFLGTTQENTKDCVSKNRQAKGENHGNSIISETQAIEILNLKGKKKAMEVSKMYGFKGMESVTRIWEGKSWKHLKPNS